MTSYRSYKSYKNGVRNNANRKIHIRTGHA